MSITYDLKYLDSEPFKVNIINPSNEWKIEHIGNYLWITKEINGLTYSFMFKSDQKILNFYINLEYQYIYQFEDKEITIDIDTLNTATSNNNELTEIQNNIKSILKKRWYSHKTR